MGGVRPYDGNKSLFTGKSKLARREPRLKPLARPTTMISNKASSVQVRGSFKRRSLVSQYHSSHTHSWTLFGHASNNQSPLSEICNFVVSNSLLSSSKLTGGVHNGIDMTKSLQLTAAGWLFVSLGHTVLFCSARARISIDQLVRKMMANDWAH